MEVLLIKNEQDLIFKSKSSSFLRKHKNKQRNNSLNFNPVKSDIVANPKLSNFINLYFDLSLTSNYLTSTSDQINLEKLNFGKFSSILNLKKVNDTRYINKFFETVKEATGKDLKAPKQLEKFVDKEEKFDILENNISEVKKYILNKLL